MDLSLTGEVNRFGYAVVKDAVRASVIDSLIAHCEADFQVDPRTRRRGGKTFGIRNLLRAGGIFSDLANGAAIRALVDPILGPWAIPVRGIFFDKTPDANWTVPWHQDLSIAVAQRAEVAGYGPWSVKADVPHVQPPVVVLQNMLTVRLHLDDCGADNGPLLVIPSSHRNGILSPQQVEDLRKSQEPFACTVKRGGVVLMRPLILHASHSATAPAHRRVVHLEYASAALPLPLRWHVG